MSEQVTKSSLGDQHEDRSDWARVAALSEAELEEAIAQDPDEDIVAPDWTRAKLVLPQPKNSNHMRVDPEVLAWYKQQGRGYLTRMHAVLRAHYEAHRDARSSA